MEDPQLVERVAGFGQARRSAAAPSLAPYYELRTSPAAWIGSAGFFVPSAGIVRTKVTGRWGWIKLDRRTARALRAAVRDLPPWPVPTLTYVRIDGTEIGAAPAYARIFDGLAPASPPPYTLPRVHIDLGSRVASPWTDGWHDVEYVASRDVLSVNGRWFQPPAALVQQIEHDIRVLRRPSEEPPSPWPAAALAVAVVSAAVGVSFVRRRLRARAA